MRALHAKQGKTECTAQYQVAAGLPQGDWLVFGHS